MTDEKAAAAFEKADKFWKKAAEKDDLANYRVAIGLYRTGLGELSEPVPELYSEFALLLYESAVLASKQRTNDATTLWNSAGEWAQKALQKRPHDFNGNLVLTYQMGDQITDKATFDDISNPSTGGFFGNLLKSGIKATQAQTSRNRFSSQLAKLLQSFSLELQNDPECINFIVYSTRLSGIAEFCRGLQLNQDFSAIYHAIAVVDLDELTYSNVNTDIAAEIKDEADDIITMAQAYLANID